MTDATTPAALDLTPALRLTGWRVIERYGEDALEFLNAKKFREFAERARDGEYERG